MKDAHRIEILDSDWKDARPETGRAFPPVLRLIRFGFQTLGRLFPSVAADLAFRLFSTPYGRARHAASDPVLESARLFEFLYGKRILKGYEWGAGEQVVLLVHGWQSRGTAMRSFVPALLEKGYRVVAFDGPAHGNSEGKRTNMVHFAGAIRALVHRLGGVHAIITHSFGGASTLYTLAELDPSIEVAKLVQIAVPASIRRIADDAIRTLALPPLVARRFTARLEKVGKRPIEQMELADFYPRSQVHECLFVHDQEDSIVPIQNALEVIEKWERSSLLMTHGYGHFRLMKNPDVVRRIADFVAG